MENYSPLIRSYAQRAGKYDRRWQHYNQATLAATIEVIPRGELLRVLDVGCGTGLLGQAVLRTLPQVRFVGLDISPSMLQQARSKLGASAQVCWINGQAEFLPVASGSVDVLVCANSFHFFRQPVGVLEEFRRVVRPGGWLALTDWCDDYLACKLCDWALRIVDAAHYRTYGLQQCEELLRNAGFQIDRARRFKIDWLWGLMTLLARA